MGTPSELDYFEPLARREKRAQVAQRWLAATGMMHFILGVIIAGVAYFLNRLPMNGLPMATFLEFAGIGAGITIAGVCYMVYAPELGRMRTFKLGVVQWVTIVHAAALAGICVYYGWIRGAVLVGAIGVGPLALVATSACLVYGVRKIPPAA